MFDFYFITGISGDKGRLLSLYQSTNFNNGRLLSIDSSDLISDNNTASGKREAAETVHDICLKTAKYVL